jgi:hypothetical protein
MDCIVPFQVQKVKASSMTDSGIGLPPRVVNG